jgi:hypothetical protein
LMFPDGLPPYPEWWSEIEFAAPGRESKARRS